MKTLLTLLLLTGCATPKPQTYEQILRSMPPDERQRVETEVSDIEAYILENSELRHGGPTQ